MCYVSRFCLSFLIVLTSITSWAAPTSLGPIVYSAREYVEPGSSGTSHSHIYVTDASGKNKRQLTSGISDDYEPSWSPDGNWIEFIRSSDTNSKDQLCMYEVATGHVSVIGDGNLAPFEWRTNPLRIVSNPTPPIKSLSYIVPSGKIFTENPDELNASPDHMWTADIDDTNHLVVRRFVNGSWIIYDAYPGKWTSDYWIGPNRLAGLTDDTTDPNADVFDINLHILDLPFSSTSELLKRKYPTSKLAGKYFGGVDNEEVINDLDYSCIWPNHPDDIIIEVNEHNSTVGTAYGFLALSLLKDKLTLLHDYATFLTFSPDGLSYVYAPGRDAVPYARWHNDHIRTVWAAPLYSVNIATGKKTILTPRTAYVDSADWRK